MMRTVTLVKGASKKAKAAGLADPGEGQVEVTSRAYHQLEALGLIKSAKLTQSPAADQPEAETAQAEAKAEAMKTFADQHESLGLSPGDVPSDTSANPGGTSGSDRGPSGTETKADPGGAGHLKDDGYSNKDRVSGKLNPAPPKPTSSSKKGA